MERSRLIEIAPSYYEIAICNFFDDGRNEVASANTVWGTTGVKNTAVFWHVLGILVAKKMLNVILDDFGPPIYTRGDRFNSEWEALKKQEGTPYYKFGLDPQRASWIASAIEAVNKALQEQKIKPDDFKNPNAEWEPLPVERSDANLQKVTLQLDKTVAAVDADNGYNATLPEEKAFVVESLKEASDKLKGKVDSVTYGYVKRKIIDVLDILIQRFGKAAVGLAAQAAKAAVFDWLKGIGGKVLHWIM
jgi:hypothetical protein